MNKTVTFHNGFLFVGEKGRLVKIIDCRSTIDLDDFSNSCRVKVVGQTATFDEQDTFVDAAEKEHKLHSSQVIADALIEYHLIGYEKEEGEEKEVEEKEEPKKEEPKKKGEKS